MSESTSTPRRRRRLVIFAVVALLVVALPVGGFVAYGAWTRNGDIVYDRGGEVFGADASPSPVVASPLPGATGTPLPAPSVATTPAVKPGKQAPVPSPAPGAKGAGKDAPKSSRPTVRAVALPARTQPIPGTYPLRVEGKENVTFGPFSFC